MPRRVKEDTSLSRWPSDNSLCMMKNNVKMLSGRGKV